MHIPSNPNFLVVTKRNKRRIRDFLADKQGSIMIGELTHGGTPSRVEDMSFHLYDRPTFDDACQSLRVKRGSRKHHGGLWATGWQNDRVWHLDRVRTPPDETGAADPEVLRIGDLYTFAIGYQSTVGRGFLGANMRTLFVPRAAPRRDAFVHLLAHFTELTNGSLEAADESDFRFGSQHIAAITNYAMQDLLDGRVLERVVGEGVRADDEYEAALAVGSLQHR